MRMILKGLIIILIVGIAYIVILSSNQNGEVIGKVDKFHVEDLFADRISEKEEITLYRAEDGWGVALQKKGILGWRAKCISKRFFNSNESWEYLEIIDSNGNIHPIIYGYVDTTYREKVSVRVKNQTDNLDEQACSFLAYNKEPWILLLDLPTKDKNAYKIYDINTNEELYPK